MSRTSEKPIWTGQLLTYNPQSMFLSTIIVRETRLAGLITKLNHYYIVRQGSLSMVLQSVRFFGLNQQSLRFFRTNLPTC